MKATLLVAWSIGGMTYLAWRSFKLLFRQYFFRMEKTILSWLSR